MCLLHRHIFFTFIYHALQHLTGVIKVYTEKDVHVKLFFVSVYSERLIQKLQNVNTELGLTY